MLLQNKALLWLIVISGILICSVEPSHP